MVETEQSQAQDLRSWIERLTILEDEMGVYAFAMRQDSPGGVAAVEALAAAAESIAQALSKLERALALTRAP